MIAVSNVHKKNLCLILTMAAIAMIVLASSLAILYNVGFQEERQRLIETAQSQARLIEAMARHDQAESGVFARIHTLNQIREAHEQFEGFGETGEFVLAALKDNKIVFLLSHRHHDLTNPHPVAFNAQEAAPMRLALQGKSGSIVGLDYRGETVLAAYEPVAELNLGVVAKIDLKEVQAPFFLAAWICSGITLIFVLIGSWVFQRITKHMAQHIEKSEELFRNTFSLAAIGLAHLSLECRWLRVNKALCDIVGYTYEELLEITFQDITHPDDLATDLVYVEQILAGEIDTYSMEKRYLRKDGSPVDVKLTVALARNNKGEPDYFIAAIEDISELIQLQNELKDRGERLEVAINGTCDGLWLWDIKTNHEWHAPQWKRLLGYGHDEVLPESYDTWENRIHPDDRNKVLNILKCHLEDNLPYDSKHRLRTKSGDYKWFRDRGMATRDDTGNPIQMGGSIQDITDLKIAEAEVNRIREELEQFSTHDALTGIGNRRVFDNMLDVEWARAQRDNHPLSIILIDVDFFKLYNDHYGHIAGDECLKQVAQILADVIKRPADLVARYGGEEFVILLPEIDAKDAVYLAEKCCRKVMESQIPHEASTVADVVTISLGVSTTVPDANKQAVTLTEAADKALYQAKVNGRNRTESI
jgi:diguanylate cyclase (GGDEF)-like protein/PAS domain S-box-containing protein